ncbi:MAG: phosphoenolpyruvate carboxykinase (ATP) [Halobacteriota archaeon]
MSDQGMVKRTAPEPVDPREAANVLYQPSDERLRELSAHLERTTEFGSPSYVSEVRSRVSDRTKNAVDHDFDDEDHALLHEAADATEKEDLVCVDLRLGDGDYSYVCRFYVEQDHARIALALTRLYPRAEDGEPEFTTVQLPGHAETAVRVLPDEGFNAVLGTDYSGEAKKSFLRLFMYRVKRAGGLGLHAGSKRVRLDGGEREVGQLFLGLSATGKSTLTAHDLGLQPPEEAVMLQDDVCGLLSDGRVVGSEPNGLYLKTDGLDADVQPDVHAAVTSEDAVIENVAVDGDGTVDFDDTEITSNGRAAVLRRDLESAAEEITLDAVDQVFFITRNPLMPPIARLTPEEAAAAFVLGESIETSAGDPERAGEAVRVVGTNPFIVGSEGDEGNRFRNLIAGLDVECYVLNTGAVGGRDVGVDVSTALLEAVARDDVEWREGPTGLEVPESAPGFDADDYDVEANVSDYASKAEALREERRSYLEGFDDLHPEIVDAVY